VCAAQELYRAGTIANRGFTTFSAVYDGLECDERPLIADLQGRCGFDARYVAPDPSAELAQLEPDRFRDRPDMATSGTTTLFDAAQSASVRVVLTGELSDNYLLGRGFVFDSLLRQ
jgi:Asparagine synthase